MKSLDLGNKPVQEIPVRCILSGLVMVSFMAESQDLQVLCVFVADFCHLVFCFLEFSGFAASS